MLLLFYQLIYCYLFLIEMGEAILQFYLSLQGLKEVPTGSQNNAQPDQHACVI